MDPLEEYVPGQTIEELALFPLPGVVFFPGTLLPLHVFEPRYRQMTLDVLAGPRRMAVVLIPNAERSDALGQPEIASVAGIGGIVQHRPLPDGRHDIVLAGHARVSLEELPFEPPYRRARATVLEERVVSVPDEDLAALVSTATRFATLLRQRDARFDYALPATLDPGLLVDACAHSLVIEADERQRLLEMLDARERVQKCCEILAVQELLMQKGALGRG